MWTWRLSLFFITITTYLYLWATYKLKQLKGNKGVKPHVSECIAARTVQLKKSSSRTTTSSSELEFFVFLGGLPTVCGFFAFLQRTEQFVIFSCHLKAPTPLIIALSENVINPKSSWHSTRAMFKLFSWSLRAQQAVTLFGRTRRKQNLRGGEGASSLNSPLPAIFNPSDLYAAKSWQRLIRTGKLAMEAKRFAKNYWRKPGGLVMHILPRKKKPLPVYLGVIFSHNLILGIEPSRGLTSSYRISPPSLAFKMQTANFIVDKFPKQQR